MRLIPKRNPVQKKHNEYRMNTPPKQSKRATAKPSATPTPAVRCTHSRIMDPASLKPNPGNPNAHPDEQLALYAKVILHQGWRRAVVVSRQSGLVVTGHGAVEMAKRNGWQVPVDDQDFASPQDELAHMLADNKLAELAELDGEQVAALLKSLDGKLDLDLTGFVGDELSSLLSGFAPGDDAAHTKLADRFGVPPFTVLDARQGYWQDRKRGWLALGIQSELGRGGSKMALHDSEGVPTPLARKKIYDRDKARTFGQDLMRGEHTVGTAAKNLTWVRGPLDKPLDPTSKKILSAGRKSPTLRSGNSLMERLTRPEGKTDIAIERGSTQTGTSIFDPVLCELVYRWFARPGWRVLDPFAGGSVRGIIAAKLGLEYTGVELRAEQVAANEEQGRTIVPGGSLRWVTGDSREVQRLAPGEYDLVFSCPPYADLEVYSDDARDLSNLGYPEFKDAYGVIIRECVALLKPNRFAVFVVGDVRGKDGFYYGLPWDTVAAFNAAGAVHYNEAVLLTAIGSLPLRVGKQFQSGRKLGKTHQNVLIFYKGDPRKIREMGGCEFGEEGDPIAPNAGAE